jgi:hypothetical protein
LSERRSQRSGPDEPRHRHAIQFANGQFRDVGSAFRSWFLTGWRDVPRVSRESWQASIEGESGVGRRWAHTGAERRTSDGNAVLPCNIM